MKKKWKRKKKKKNEKKWKGFEKKLLLAISEVEGRKKCQNEKKMKKNEKGSRKSSFWQFPRSILKAKEGKNAKTKKKWKKMKRVREKAPFGNSLGQF